VFAEYGNGGSGGGLDNIIPIAWHGDEGRGKRRGNTVCVSMESVIGVETVLRKKRKLTPTAGCRKCQPPGVFNQKYSTVSNSLDADMLAHVHDQWTTMKGHSFCSTLHCSLSQVGFTMLTLKFSPKCWA